MQTTRKIGLYEICPPATLLLVATGQRLICISDNPSELVFKYSDPDFAVSLTATAVREDGLQSDAIEFDLNATQNRALSDNYGKWRRLSWFLLDAMLVMLVQKEWPQQRIELRGGWIGGEWDEDFCLTSVFNRSDASNAYLQDHGFPPTLYPIDMPAPEWTFYEGLPGAREGRIALLKSQGKEQFADLSVAPELQLVEVPRFESDAGEILFFHKVNPHVGPDYAPSMDYGFLSESHVHYFSERHGSLRELPTIIPRSSLAKPGGYLDGRQPVLAADLREKQFFAGIEAANISRYIKLPDMPEMADIKHGQECAFGFGLGRISDAPISVGFPSAGIGYHWEQPRGTVRYMRKWHKGVFVADAKQATRLEANEGPYLKLGLALLALCAVFRVIDPSLGGSYLRRSDIFWFWFAPILSVGLILFAGFKRLMRGVQNSAEQK